MTVTHETGDRFQIEMGSHRLVTDQPWPSADTGPAPVELFVASLAACAAFYGKRFLARHGLADGDLRVDADYTMADEHPARVGVVDLRLRIPFAIPDDVRAGLLRAVEQCTVLNSIRRPPTVLADVLEIAPVGVEAEGAAAV